LVFYFWFFSKLAGEKAPSVVYLWFSGSPDLNIPLPIAGKVGLKVQVNLEMSGTSCQWVNQLQNNMLKLQ
jgi:hypothetical protein